MAKWLTHEENQQCSVKKKSQTKPNSTLLMLSLKIPNKDPNMRDPKVSLSIYVTSHQGLYSPLLQESLLFASWPLEVLISVAA